MEPQEPPKDDDRREYEPPQLTVLATVQEATLMGTEGLNPDGMFTRIS